MKKVNIPTDLGIKSHKDLTGLAATLSGSYRLDGTTDAWTPFAGPFSEDSQNGTYLVKHAFTAAGIYALKFESTNDAIGTHYGKVEVGLANIDDVKAAIDAAQGDITAIKSHVEAMDSEVLDAINTTTSDIDSTLTTLTELINDESNPAVTSLRELLAELKTAGTDRDSLITTLGNVLKDNTDDLEAMIRGDEFLADGVSANPFFGKSGHAIYDKLVLEVQNIKDDIETAKTTIENSISTAKIALEGKIAEVKTVVDSNASVLGHADHGNAALKAAIDALSSTNGDDIQDVKDLLEDATNGLAAIKTAIIDLLTSMDSKLDVLVNRSDIAVIA